MKNRIIGYTSLILFAVCLLINQSSSMNGVPYIDRLLYSFNIPVWSKGDIGTRYPGIITLLIIIISLIIFSKYKIYTNKFLNHHPIVVLIAIALVVPRFDNSVERLIARFSSGTNSLYIPEDIAQFSYEHDGEIVEFSVCLSLENLNKDPVQVDLYLLPINDIILEPILLSTETLYQKGGSSEHSTYTMEIPYQGTHSGGSGWHSNFKLLVETDTDYRIINLSNKP